MLDFNLRINGYLPENRIKTPIRKTAGPPIVPEIRQDIQQARPPNAHNLAPFPAACQSQIAGILEARRGPEQGRRRTPVSVR